jgi:hypothetical protein
MCETTKWVALSSRSQKTSGQKLGLEVRVAELSSLRTLRLRAAEAQWRGRGKQLSSIHNFIIARFMYFCLEDKTLLRMQCHQKQIVAFPYSYKHYYALRSTQLTTAKRARNTS